MACGKSELNIFDSVPTQVAITSSSFSDYHPISKVINTAEFVINTSSYLDLNDSILVAKLCVKNKDGTALVKDANCCLVNNALSSIIKDVSVCVNGVQIENTNTLYPYKSLFNILLNYDADSSNSQFDACGFYKTDNINDIHANNKEMVAKSKSISLAGPLFLDLFMQSKYIIPNTELRIKLTLSSNEFVVKSPDAKLKLRYELDDLVLYVRSVNVHPSVEKAHMDGLKLNNAIYPLQKTELKYFNIANGSTSFSIENIFSGRIPKFVCFAMVKSSAQNGSFKENPFNFKHNNVNFIGLYRNGIAVNKEMTPDFENNLIAREYMSLLQACNIYAKNISNSISFEEFQKDGYVIFAYNLTPDLESSSVCKQTNMLGNLRLDLRFAKALTESINLIFMGVFDGELQITKTGDVFI